MCRKDKVKIAELELWSRLSAALHGLTYEEFREDAQQAFERMEKE